MRTKDGRELTLLRESFVFNNTDYTLVPQEEVKKRKLIPARLSEQLVTDTPTETLVTQALALRERVTADFERSILDKVIAKLRESGSDSSFKVWRLPVGRYGNLNGNKRVYPKKLWENVRDLQTDKWQGICGLCDHPEKDDDPGKARDQAIVWHDIEVPEGGLVYGYGTFVGQLGRLAQEIIECGGRCGFSSSGFGDVNPVTKEVDPETYIIERLADIVINPSQNVYGTAECTHTPAEFMKDVHAGATIEFGKQEAIREAQSAILSRRMNMDASQVTADAAQGQQQAAPAPAAQAPAQGAPAPSGQAPQPQPQAVAPQQQAQPQQQVQESAKKSIREALTSIEERAFRKHVDVFMREAGEHDNPIRRLSECKEILNYFEGGACPDLKEKLEEQIKAEQESLEKLVETTLSVQGEYGFNDITKLKENAEKIAAQGLLLNEQVTDYKALCEALTDRNRKLAEDNKKLLTALKLKSKIVEKTEVKSTKRLASASSELDELREEVAALQSKNDKLLEKVSSLSQGNKSLEKMSGKNETRLKEAVSLLKQAREASISDEETIRALNKKIDKLNESLDETERCYNAQSRRFKKLEESYTSLQSKLEDDDPVKHLMPRSSERVGKFINLREGKGADVELYWEDLNEQYGDAVKLFENEIRNAKTLREATTAFLKHRAEIDPDFAIAQPTNQYAYRNRAERAKLLEFQGIPVPGATEYDVEAINADFLDRANRAGLR